MAEIDAIAKVVALIEGRADLAFGPSDPAVKTRKKPVKK
jgi:hypothetical protein